MLAAIYARYSSDNQRDESIEIQVERCTELIQRNGWTLGEVYADYAMTGTNAERPSFQRCIADGCDGLYDVLVIYKRDRFARNVEVSRRYKGMLMRAGVRIVSVYEGESMDDPASFLHEGMDELFAEYYSKNLSVMIRNGIRKNAENCKASGIRIFGYDVDPSDRFVINEGQAEIVRSAFTMYLAGTSVADIARWMGERGVLTKFGKPWSTAAVCKMLRRVQYMGTYEYCGNRVEGGMPAIVDADTWNGVQVMLDTRGRTKRRHREADYLLTGKLLCAECGEHMGGTSGKSKNGEKYTYYHCRHCGCVTVPQETLEEAVVNGVRELISDPSCVQSMVEAVLDADDGHAATLKMYEGEREELLKRRERLVESIADGVPASVVKEPLVAAQERLEELDRLIAVQQRKVGNLNERAVREWLDRFVLNPDEMDSRYRHLIVDTWLDAVHTDGEWAFVTFSYDGSHTELTAEDMEALKRGEPPRNPRSTGVRLCSCWWRLGDFKRTPFTNGTAFVIALPL